MSPRIRFVAIALFLSAFAGHARFITLTIGRTGAVDKPTDEVAIGTNEVAVITTWGGETASTMAIIKDGITNQSSSSGGFYTLPYPVNVAGPATIPLEGGNSAKALLTAEIKPESFPPDKSLIIPEGTGANVTFECSTNLLDWNPVWQGAYTNSPSNKFFRIRAERFP
jgi:hypothetical protein